MYKPRKRDAETKQVRARLMNSVCDELNAKLQLDEISTQELLETAIYSYLYDNSQTICKSGKIIEITVKITD